MERLPKDVLVMLALDLNIKEILNLCLTSRRYNRLVCENENFWRNKLLKETGKVYTNAKEILLKIDRNPARELNIYLKSRDNELARFILRKYPKRISSQLIGIKTSKEFNRRKDLFKSKYPDIYITLLSHHRKTIYLPDLNIKGIIWLNTAARLLGIKDHEPSHDVYKTWSYYNDSIIERLMELGLIYKEGDPNPLYKSIDYE